MNEVIQLRSSLSPWRYSEIFLGFHPRTAAVFLYLHLLKHKLKIKSTEKSNRDY